ncbi:MAG: squalene/phytoene synthase family protein, partial [Pseudomonadota bacterium]
ARAGRVYLPLDWLAEAGVDVEAFLARPQIDYRLRGVIKRVLDTADDLYARSAGGIAGLPLDCRPAIHAARLIYREIGRELARADYDSVSSRAVVSSRRKLALLGAACAAASVTSRSAARPALEETAFLVQSVPPGVDPPKQRFVAELDRRVGRVLEIFDHMDARTDGTYGGRDVGPAQ